MPPGWGPLYISQPPDMPNCPVPSSTGLNAELPLTIEVVKAHRCVALSHLLFLTQALNFPLPV